MNTIELERRSVPPLSPRGPRTARTLLAAALLAGFASAQVVFSTDFEQGLPPEFAAPVATIEGVQGFAGFGPQDRRFAGNFLRYAATSIQPTTLTLHNLPPHTSVDLEFLLAIIDSWDGVELMEVRVDGQLLFSHWFQQSQGNSTSYLAPPAGLLTSDSNLGFNTNPYFFNDSAYDLGVDPVFRGIPHSGINLTVEWIVNATTGGVAQAWQGGSDESWGIDAVRVRVGNAGVWRYGTSCGQPLLGVMQGSHSWPLLGATFRSYVVGVPANVAFLALGLSNTTLGGTDLPQPLGQFGMPGCYLLQDLFQMALLCTSVNAATAQHDLAIPGDATLAGLRVYLQAWAPAPGVNPAGLVASHGLELLLAPAF